MVLAIRCQEHNHYQRHREAKQARTYWIDNARDPKAKTGQSRWETFAQLPVDWENPMSSSSNALAYLSPALSHREVLTMPKLGTGPPNVMSKVPRGRKIGNLRPSV